MLHRKKIGLPLYVRVCQPMDKISELWAPVKRFIQTVSGECQRVRPCQCQIRTCRAVIIAALLEPEGAVSDAICCARAGSSAKALARASGPSLWVCAIRVRFCLLYGLYSCFALGNLIHSLPIVFSVGSSVFWCFRAIVAWCA